MAAEKSGFVLGIRKPSFANPPTMAHSDLETLLEQAAERTEAAVLPSLPMMLDSLLDAASLARPGIDADAYAVEIKTMALELYSITRDLEAICTARSTALGAYPRASAA
jgi:hypothetical protein